MPEDLKICPLMSKVVSVSFGYGNITSEFKSVTCSDNCAWFIPMEGVCAMKLVGEKIHWEFVESDMEQEN